MKTLIKTSLLAAALVLASATADAGWERSGSYSNNFSSGSRSSSCDAGSGCSRDTSYQNRYGGEANSSASCQYGAGCSRSGSAQGAGGGSANWSGSVHTEGSPIFHPYMRRW